MKTFAYQHQIERYNNQLVHVYTARIESSSQDLDLIKDTLNNLMQIHFENEHIDIQLEQRRDHLYYGEYIEFEFDPTKDLNDFATLLQSYTGWDLETCQLITHINYTPITKALTSKKDCCLYYNSKDQIFEHCEYYPNEEHLEIEINQHIIIIYID